MRSLFSWLSRGATARGAALTLACLAVAAPVRAELAFKPEGVRYVCAGAAPAALQKQGNAVIVPVKGDAELRNCRVEIDFAVQDATLVSKVMATGYVELVALGLQRATFPTRFAINRGGVASGARPGGLTLVLSAEGLFADERRNGAGLTLAWRSGDGPEARSYISPTILIERADRPLKRNGKPPTPQ